MGATHGAALPWLPPAMKRAQALQRIWDVPSGAAQRSGLQGGCGPSPSVWLVRGRGAFPHIAFTMDYIRCGDVNGAGTAVTSVHLSILPSIHPSAHPPAHPLFLHSFSNSPFLSLSLSLFISLSFCLSVSVSLSLFPVGAGVSVLAQTMEEDTLDDFASDHGASLSMESFTQKSLVSSPEVVTIPFIPHPSLSP